jgi:hypothetical protein
MNGTRAFFIPGSSVLRSATYWKPKAVSSTSGRLEIV